MRIQLLGGEWEPRLPRSFVQRQEILMSYERGVDDVAQLRVWGAALGVTWNHPDRTKTIDASMENCGFLPRAYGQMVADELLQAGVGLGDLIVQGQIAFEAIAKSIISQKEIEKRAGFSSAAPASESRAAEEVGTT